MFLRYVSFLKTERRVKLALGSILVILFLLSLPFQPGVSVRGEGFQKEISESWPVSTRKEVVVRNRVGEIRVRGSGRNEIELRAILNAEDRETLSALSVEIGEDERRIKIVSKPLSLPAHFEGSIDISLTVPRAAGLRLRVASGVGPFYMEDFAGSLNLKLGVGKLDLRDSKLAEGAIELGQGKVELVRMRGEMLSLKIGAAEELFLDQVNFSDLQAEVGAGSIKLILPRGSWDVTASTGAGEIKHDGFWEAGARVEETDRLIGEKIRIQLGDGGKQIRLSQGAGGIELTLIEGLEL